jgi:signal transduction histidine kinase
MFSPFSHLWNRISNTGIAHAQTERERKDVVLLNRTWLVLMLTQVACLVSHLINGLERSAFMTAAFIAGLSVIHFYIRNGKINPAKIAAIAVINANTVVMGIFFGVQSHVIDFLLLTALLPLYFFDTKSKKLIFWGIALSVIPFAIYHVVVPGLAQYALPMNEQLMMFKATTWEKVCCLSILLYLIYHKNINYEKEVQEKEMQLAGQKKLYELMLEQIPIDIVTFDKQLRYTYINSTAIKDKELREWMIGKTNVDYFKARNLDMQIAAQRDSILIDALGREEAIETEESYINRHGKKCYSIKGASPLYNEDKSELLCLIGYSLDITAIKEAEEKLKQYAIELEKKNEDLHHFVNATSHDLKTPLRNIASYLQLIERKNQAILDEDSRSMMAYTVKSVKHLNQLINDIYHYSVADQNDKPAEITDLNAVLSRILLEMENTIDEKGAEIKFSELPVVKAAPSHLAMIFSNLLGNAIKYNNSEKPAINISSQVSENEYIISVADNGIGIAPEYNRQIFEMFRRLHTSEEYEGTGVGLAICTKIIDNYGGKLWVESEPGKGSVFHFSLSRLIVDPENETSHKIQPYNKFAIAS